MRFAAFLFASLSLCTASAGDNWPQFRGPNGDGVSDSKGLPLKWSETENIRWKATVHDKGWSSPVVWGNQVWVTTATEKGTAYYAVCLDRKTGAVVHDLHLFDANPKDISQYNSFATPTPAIEAGRVYIHFGSFGTACLDTATGKKVWERTDLPCDHFRGPASSPVVYKDWLYLQFDGFDLQYIVCLNKNTGKTVWRKDRTLPYPANGDLKKAYATPSVFVVNGRAQVVSPAAVGTIAYDAETGEEIWRVIHQGMNEAIRPIHANGLIYLNSGHTMNLLAVKAGQTGDLTGGGVVWKVKESSSRPSPLVIGDYLYMVNDTGVAFCYDAKTGEQKWKERLGAKFSASPVWAAGNIYLPSEDGKTFVVAASPTFSLVSENRLDAGCRASPAVAGEALFLRTTGGFVYCIGK